jgi:hypothetical protein
MADIGYPMITEEAESPLTQRPPCQAGDLGPIPHNVGPRSKVLSTF